MYWETRSQSRRRCPTEKKEKDAKLDTKKPETLEQETQTKLIFFVSDHHILHVQMLPFHNGSSLDTFMRH